MTCPSPLGTRKWHAKALLLATQTNGSRGQAVQLKPAAHIQPPLFGREHVGHELPYVVASAPIIRTATLN